MQGESQLLPALRAAVVRYPALPLTAAAGAVLVWFAAANGGFDPTTWYPAALIVLSLVAVAMIAVPWAAVSAPVRVALAALVLYAAWSYLSIAWAVQKGDAWDGANRTLLYLLLFALFALWRPRGRPAAAIVGVLTLAVATIGLVELVRVASSSHPASFFLGGRFAAPSGYQNANVALWSSAFLAAVALAARRELLPPLRGLLAAAAVLLGGLAILGQSRGWLFAAPIALIAFVAIVPQRVRTTLTLLAVGAGVAAAAPSLLHVYQEYGRRGYGDAISTGAVALVVAAVVVGVVVTVAALGDRRARPSAEQGRRAALALAAVGALVAIAGLGVFVAKEGSPFHAVSKGWRDFKTHGQPSSGPTASSSRFSQSLGSGRYDFWRVAWGRFEHAPLQGIGADNFQEAYLARAKTDEQPRYPHSLELRTLSQTGLVGFGLLATALVAALIAAGRALRLRRGIGGAAAAAALAWFLYWLVHGSVDWFWEIPALAAPAFAMLGLAAGLAPAPAVAYPPLRRRPLATSMPAAALLLLVVPAALSLAGPWASELESESAAAVWPQHSQRAYDRLDTAAGFNPLTSKPKLLAGSIALRLGQRARAEREFRAALERDPGDEFSNLELGALLAQRGRRAEAVVRLRRAHSLNPRDDIVVQVLHDVRAGRRVNIDAVNNEIAQRSEERGK